MLPSQLETLLPIAARENEITPQVLEAYRSKAVSKAATLEQRGSVAVLNVIGPLFRRANLFTEISGATSYDILRRDLQVALDDDSVTSILLNVDSPGGDANGCDELAKAIFAARAVKQVSAYVGGTAASGGYWLASAASQIVVSDASLLGSIGVVLSLRDTKARDATTGVRTFEFVSSQSPHKRSDPATRAGEDELQRIADDLAEVFISAVAKQRNVSAETVVSDFGSGGILIGAKAIQAGMADRIGTFEDTLQQLQAGARSPGRLFQTSPKGRIMSDQTGPKSGDDLDAIKADNERLKTSAAKASADAKTRIKTIMTASAAKGREGLAEHFAYDTEMTAEAAVAALDKAPLPAAPEAVPAPPSSTAAADIAALEANRLNGEGLNGKAPATASKSSQILADYHAVTGMKKSA
jgi:signal peptide peptidase SppA